MFSEGPYYRSVIVYVSLASSFLGLIAIVSMKATELWQSKRNSTCKETEPEPTCSPALIYGTIQNGTVHQSVTCYDNYYTK